MARSAWIWSETNSNTKIGQYVIGKTLPALMRLNICCSIKTVMSELGVNVKAWIQPQITCVQWQGHCNDLRNTFVRAGLAWPWFWWTVATGFLDWVTWSWTQDIFCNWRRCYPPIHWARVLYMCMPTQKRKNNYYHSHSKRRARWYNIKLVRVQPWHVHSGCTQGPRWAACLWGRGQVEEMVCSVYNLAHRTAGCCSGWPEWQDAAAAETRSLKFPKYQSNKKNVTGLFVNYQKLK